MNKIVELSNKETNFVSGGSLEDFFGQETLRVVAVLSFSASFGGIGALWGIFSEKQTTAQKIAANIDRKKLEFNTCVAKCFNVVEVTKTLLTTNGTVY